MLIKCTCLYSHRKEQNKQKSGPFTAQKMDHNPKSAPDVLTRSPVTLSTKGLDENEKQKQYCERRARFGFSTPDNGFNEFFSQDVADCWTRIN